MTEESTETIHSTSPTASSFDDGLVEDLLPGAVHRPAFQAFVGGFPGPVALGQVPPGCAGVQFPQNRVDHLAVIAPASAAGVVRQQWGDTFPGLVGEFTTFDHVISGTTSERGLSTARGALTGQILDRPLWGP